MMKNIVSVCLLLFTGIVLSSQSLEAHSIGRSSSYWDIKADGVSARWAMSQREFEILQENGVGEEPSQVMLFSFLRANIAISAAENACELSGTQFTRLSGGDVSIAFDVACVPGEISLSGLFDKAPRHVHLAHLSSTSEAQQQVLLTADRSLINFDNNDQEAGFLATATDYTKLGFLHILEGLDHLAFLIALLLIVRDIRSLFWVISGFTLGHSITLIFGALGVLAAEPDIIEPLIAFSIAFTAIDALIAKSSEPSKPLLFGLVCVVVLFTLDRYLNIQIPLIAWLGVLLLSGSVWMFGLQGEEQSKKILPIVTIGFGLIHGFGFAGVLSELGLPQEGKFTALLGFNLGVEIGQIVFVSAMLLLASVHHFFSKKTNDFLRLLVSWAVIALGLYWFAERVFF